MVVISIRTRENRHGELIPVTTGEETVIQEAANDAELSAIRAYSALDSIWNQPGRGKTKRDNRKNSWRANATVIRWFGSDKLTNDEIRDTHRRLRKVREEFEDEMHFTIIREQTGRKSYRCDRYVGAYCSPGSSVKICPRFFILGPGLRQRRARLFIHELCHKNFQLRHHNGAIDHSSALQLALDNPRAARSNPENFAGFCDEYYSPT